MFVLLSLAEGGNFGTDDCLTKILAVHLRMKQLEYLENVQ